MILEWLPRTAFNRLWHNVHQISSLEGTLAYALWSLAQLESTLNYKEADNSILRLRDEATNSGCTRREILARYCTSAQETNWRIAHVIARNKQSFINNTLSCSFYNSKWPTSEFTSSLQIIQQNWISLTQWKQFWFNNSKDRHSNIINRKWWLRERG